MPRTTPQKYFNTKRQLRQLQSRGYEQAKELLSDLYEQESKPTTKPHYKHRFIILPSVKITEKTQQTLNRARQFLYSLSHPPNHIPKPSKLETKTQTPQQPSQAA